MTGTGRTPGRRRYPRVDRVNKVLRQVVAEELERLDRSWKHYVDYKNRYLAS